MNKKFKIIIGCLSVVLGLAILPMFPVVAESIIGFGFGILFTTLDD